MHWTWKSGTWKSERGESGKGRRARKQPEAVLRQELGRRGLGADEVDLLLPRLLPRFQNDDRVAREALLDGAALACAARSDLAEQLARSLNGLAELERMMGAFSGELGKLDEVLEVLSAYVRRMRSSKPVVSQAPGDGGLLH